MKLKTGSILLLVVLMTVLFANTTLAVAPRYGARAYGMGGAFTAVADDSSAIYWNPAGLKQNSVSINTSLGIAPDPDFIEDAKNVVEMTEGSPEQRLALLALDDTEMGFDLMLTTNIKSVSLGAFMSDYFSYDSNNMRLKNRFDGQGVISFNRELKEKLTAGLNLKKLWSRYDSVEEDSGTTFEGAAEANGYGVDLGLLVDVTDNVKLGFAAKNLVSELDWEWAEEPVNSAEHNLEDSLPRRLTVGTAVELPLSMTLAADYENVENGGDIYRVGMEKNILFNGVSLRAGTYKQESKKQVYTGGIGFNLAIFHCDLALDDNGYLSLSGELRF